VILIMDPSDEEMTGLSALLDSREYHFRRTDCGSLPDGADPAGGRSGALLSESAVTRLFEAAFDSVTRRRHLHR
jgi:hypothetical protein